MCTSLVKNGHHTKLKMNQTFKKNMQDKQRPDAPDIGHAHACGKV